MMKLSSLVFLAVCLVGTFAVPNPKALTVRGGAKLGPLDAKLALDLSKAATTAYAAGSASKYINRQTGGKDADLATFVTGDLFQLHAIITSVACGMFGLLDTGFADLKLIALGSLLALGLKLKDDGVNADTFKDNALQGVLAVLLTVLAFVD